MSPSRSTQPTNVLPSWCTALGSPNHDHAPPPSGACWAAAGVVHTSTQRRAATAPRRDVIEAEGSPAGAGRLSARGGLGLATAALALAGQQAREGRLHEVVRVGGVRRRQR